MPPSTTPEAMAYIKEVRKPRELLVCLRIQETERNRYPPAPPQNKTQNLYPKSIPVLELTHNHGTESQDGFRHHSGNEEPNKGFGHIGFLVDDLDSFCDALEQNGVEFKKKPSEGNMKGLAFALDPDGYWVEVIGRGLQVEEC